MKYMPNLDDWKNELKPAYLFKSLTAQTFTNIRKTNYSED